MQAGIQRDTEYESAEHDEHGSDRWVPAEVLAEEKHGKNHGERSLQVQNQRARDGRHALQSDQQENRRHDGTGHGHAEKQRHV